MKLVFPKNVKVVMEQVVPIPSAPRPDIAASVMAKGISDIKKSQEHSNLEKKDIDKRIMELEKEMGELRKQKELEDKKKVPEVPEVKKDTKAMAAAITNLGKALGL